MPTERVQRQIDQHLDAAESASLKLDWAAVKEHAQAVLDLDADNQDAPTILAAAERAQARQAQAPLAEVLLAPPAQSLASPAPPAQPTSFANGRYEVRRFLGEGGKKKVYLAHDSLLDRDVAFALIKTEGLDDAGRVRVNREAQAMGRLGNHPNIVTVYDIGDEAGQPYLVLPILSGGDVEGVIEKAPEHKLPLEQALRIAIETCQGLELAHSKGIVHRDLKPGNVWLTEDGRAMIGDFGLAVAADRSRLTQAGMMVGTVSYMPPEQAMGGEVGPRSDLYSLGAMLYEMVCGRPPFVGDESVAIIGQHLNTPPVAPTWHRPDCPPALETLILRLLEKDPSKRPASATEVRQALESVNVRTFAPRHPSVAVESPSAENPLYRRTFVGRENEVRQLQAAFDAALSGQGGLVMVVGEPGIGKTAICEQLATYVALRGGKALVGHCYEEGSLSLPYLAFVEAMRSYVLAREPDGLRSDLGTGAADVARIVSEVRDRVQGLELRRAGDPEDDRWRLLQSVMSFLRNASTVQPLVIILEDLHWADRGTLDLLLHIARNLVGARILIIGTYRDVEVDRSHPLSGTLGDLRRIATFARVPLRGLTAEEVQRMMAGVAQRDIPWPFAELLHRQTEGNPLFVQEMLRYLVEEGLVAEQAGQLRRVGEDSLVGRIPEGLRDVIGRRLSRLSAECNRLLAIASVIGRDFRLDTLRLVANAAEEALVSGLEEATRIGVLEEQTRTGIITYRFTHAFFRQTLYEEMSAPRRLRMHQDVARVLEAQYASRRQEHAAELAEHFANSTDRADLAKAVEYGELAAERAMSVFDYGEAARLLEKTIDVQEVLDPDDAVNRYHLLLAIGKALMPAGENFRVIETVAPAALALAVSLRDNGRSAGACTLALEAISRAQMNMAEPLALEWALKADQFAGQEDIGRVDADIAMGRSLALARGSKAQAWQFLQRALSLARKLGDQEAVISASLAILGFAANSHWDPGRGSDVRQLAEALAEAPLETMGSQMKASVSSQLGRVLLSMGERTRAENAWRILPELARRTQDASIISLSILREGRLAETDGQLETAVAAFRKMTAQSEALGLSDAVTPLNQIRTLTHLGRANEALALARDNIKQYESSSSAYRNTALLAFCLAVAASRDEAQAALNMAFAEIQPNGETSISDLVWVLEASLLLEDRAVALALAPQLHVVRDSLTCRNPVSIARLLGEASVLLDRPKDARIYYDEGLELCERVHFRPEIALIRLDLSELLLEHYPDERDAAIEHLDFAIAELRDMKMQPALERALRHRGLLKA